MVPSPTTTEEVPKRRLIKWLYVVLPLVALLLIGMTCILLLCRNKSVTTIGPFKTGLSGQLQKAFVTGNVFYLLPCLILFWEVILSDAKKKHFIVASPFHLQKPCSIKVLAIVPSLCGSSSHKMN
jgi:ABC-type tungstate transport system substrate-binding protein